MGRGRINAHGHDRGWKIQVSFRRCYSISDELTAKPREYDISADSEEPKQVLSFIPEKKTRSFLAQDPAEREVTSFTLGRGRADWGPLTVYALTRSGDIYAICPYMPRNA